MRLENMNCTGTVPVEPDNLKTQMHMTAELLNEALARAVEILADISRSSLHNKDAEPKNIASLLDAAHDNRDMAEHICDVLKEIATQLGVQR